MASDQVDMSTLYSNKSEHDLLDDHYRIGKSGAPVLRGDLTRFECESWVYYDGGDHVIVVGKVIEMDNKPGANPLVSQAGK